jgi:hypothetical protein
VRSPYFLHLMWWEICGFGAVILIAGDLNKA